MCGIAGIVSYAPYGLPVSSTELERIRDAMFRRGPDGEGIWVSEDRRAGLAHRRLAIIDLSINGAQPMSSADGRFHITFNGEIYNYRELRKSLERDGCCFRSNSDTEVLIHLFAKDGAAMVRKLRGMYAFAIYDSANRSLFLARDPFGIKPLYYSHSNGTFRFASQVKALLKADQIDRGPEPAGHVGFFVWGHVPEPYTLYKGIRALPAGTTLVVDSSGPRKPNEFFSLTTELAANDVYAQPLSQEEIHERVRAALVDSVRHHLIADVPVGVFLSSGLDSTTLAALAAEASPRGLHTVTLGFDELVGTSNDETRLAVLTAEQYGTVHHSHLVTKKDFQSELHAVFDAMDQPSIDGVNSYFVSKAAAESGLKVAISGLGGDELFGGYPSFGQLPKLVNILAPFGRLPMLGRGFRHIAAPLLKQLTSPKYAGILEYGSCFAGAYLLRRGFFMPWELPEQFDSETAREGWDELQTLPSLEATVRGLPHARLKVRALESAWYMRNQLLRDADWASMAHSLEVRLPFVDVDLWRAIIPLLNSKYPPNKQMMAGTPTKRLPKAVLTRPKTGFSIPVRNWLLGTKGLGGQDRGLRGWAHHVYRECAVENNLIAQIRRPVVMIYRVGQLGDTLVSLPAIEKITRIHPGCRFILLTDHQPKYVSSWDVLGPTGWFDSVLYYDTSAQGVRRVRVISSLLISLRMAKVDHFFNLAPGRGKWRALRDKWFFRTLGGVIQYHPPSISRIASENLTRPLPFIEPEWRHILSSLNAPACDDSQFNFQLPERAKEEIHQVAAQIGIDLDRRILAIGPGSKMSAKRWPTQRYAEVGARLLREFADLQIAVIGGEEDSAMGHSLCADWGSRSFNFAGRLSVYGSAALLGKCVAYFGNDSGTMHLAGMVGIRCVALFSARDYPGKWTPYGKRHVVIRKEVECEGCMREVCDTYNNKCLTGISPDEAYVETRNVLLAAREAIRIPQVSGSV
jgi:asparagine synthase (glutamine-hydrolysing)